MTELNLLSNEKLQKAAELARRNVERLKAQASEPKPPPVTRAHRGTRGGRRNLNPTSKATLVHTLGGSALFVKPPSLLDSIQEGIS